MRLSEEVAQIERLDAAGYMEISKGDFRCGNCTALRKEQCSINKAKVSPEKGCCNKFYPLTGAADKKDWAANEATMKKLERLVENMQRQLEGTDDEAVRNYISHIVNKDKKEYARAYWAWKQGGEEGAEPAHPNLGTMGAQAVRIAIAGILKGEGAWSLMSEPAREALFRKTPADRYAADTRSMLKAQQHKLPTDIPEDKKPKKVSYEELLARMRKRRED